MNKMNSEIKIPLKKMEFWYSATKKDLIEAVKERYKDKFVDIENPVGHCLWVKRTVKNPPYLLVHHIDTVQPHSKNTFVAYKHKEKMFIHSPHNDDRLGVATALDVLPENGYDNYDILITDMEETGQTTARAFMGALNVNLFSKEDTKRINSYKALVEYDRAGSDWVAYNYKNEAAEKYLVENLKWKKGHGSFTDIKAMEALGIFGVNFGIGYKNPHQATGYASLNQYAFSIGASIKFMMHFENHEGKLKNEPAKIYVPPKNNGKKNKTYTPVGKHTSSFKSNWTKKSNAVSKANDICSSSQYTISTMGKIENKEGAPFFDYDSYVRAYQMRPPTKVDDSDRWHHCELCGAVGSLSSYIFDSDDKNAMRVCEACIQVLSFSHLQCAVHPTKYTSSKWPHKFSSDISKTDDCLLFCSCKIEGITPTYPSITAAFEEDFHAKQKDFPGSPDVIEGLWLENKGKTNWVFAHSNVSLSKMTMRSRDWPYNLYHYKDGVWLFASEGEVRSAYGHQFMIKRGSLIKKFNGDFDISYLEDIKKLQSEAEVAGQVLQQTK